MIETVLASNGEVLAYIIHDTSAPSTTRFLTPPDCNLQVGHVVYPAAGQIPRHIHLPIERRTIGTAEVLIVQQGRCSVDVYTTERELVATRELTSGDIMISVGGGHGFRVHEDLVLLEIKQGPYPAGAEKERF